MAFEIGRRQLIAVLAGTAIARPLAVRAQQTNRVRRIGVTTSLSSDDPEGRARNTAFLQELQGLGWTVGRNLQIDYRWGAGDTERNRKNAAELVALAPDVILVTGAPTLEPLLQLTRILPIVFLQVADPVGARFVASMARPDGNATGFSTIDYGTSGRWLQLLKEIVPNVMRVAVLRDGATTIGIGQLAAIQTEALSLGVELHPIGVADAAEIERMIDTFAREPNGGLIVTESGPAVVHREQIIELAARNRLPAVYPQRVFVAGGGLISYGPNSIDPYRRAAGYVDRILKGEKPADLPVQAPTKFELVVNLKTAKALGLTVPQSLLVTADEVIE